MELTSTESSAGKSDAADTKCELDSESQTGELAVASRANSRSGVTDLSRRSYPPVESVRRALDLLTVVNKMRIASINSLHQEVGLPKSTIVRLLETLISEGYVVRDNMCGGYRVTSRVRDLSAGYDGLLRAIEVARPLAIELTRRTKWPSGLGVLDGDEISVRFWTGAISPYCSEMILGIRTDLLTSSMGRAYLAFCSDDERDTHLAGLRAETELGFGDHEEQEYRELLKQIRMAGYATREPHTWPYRRTSISTAICENGNVQAVISLSFFTTAVPEDQVAAQIIAPLRETVAKIEEALSFCSAETAPGDLAVDAEQGF